MTNPLTVRTPQTTHFGFTRVNEGEAFSKDGWAFSDADRVRLDDLLYALTTHGHTGEPPLGDPTDVPTLSAVSTGGHLPSATSFFYRVSYIDKFGLETAAGPEASVTTSNAIAAPAAPSAAIETSSGTLGPGIYSYLVTFYDAYGGETTPSNANNVQVTTGETNRIRLDFGDLADGAAGMKVYRSRPGQSQFYLVGTVITGSFYDDGIAEDQTITANTTNTTNSANSIEVTIPLGFVPDGCHAWRIYRASVSGGYDGNSLVHEVSEGVTDISIIPRITWVDTGDSLLPGFPHAVSTTIGDGVLLTLDNLSGTLPLDVIPRGTRVLNFFAAGAIQDGTIIAVTESPNQVKPARITAYFKTPPTGQQVVTFRFGDNRGVQSVYATLDCPATPQTGDMAGYYHYEWPLVETRTVYMTDPGDVLNGVTVPAVTVSDSTTVGLITDELADTGQSMLLDSGTEWAQGNLGTIDAGIYRAYASLRVEGDDASTGRFSVYRLDTNAEIAGANFTTSTTAVGFNDTPVLNFTAPGGVALALRVTRATFETAIESVRFATDVPTLQAGQIVLEADIQGAVSAGADANISLWF